MMRCCSKEQIIEGAATKSPMAERELCHICPAKLSKRELEDLYFALLQTNLELKKTVNRQNERIKILSTKLQRMTATQKTYLGKEPQDCCSPTKALVQEQKNTIAELTNMNEQLQEHIKQLNMKLCSTKQFLKRGGQPASAASQSKTTRPPSRPGSNKNLSTSALHAIKKTDNINDQVKSVSCQCLVKAITNKTRSMSTDPSMDNDNLSKSCDENKCKSLMEELKLKIVNLQEELSKTHDEYSNRITRLEQEVADVRTENDKVRSESCARALSLERQGEETRRISQKLRAAECQCDELTSKLMIEKGKVAELETQVKAANMTTQAVKTVEEKISSINMIQSPRDTFAEYRDSVPIPSKDNAIKKIDNIKLSTAIGDGITSPRMSPTSLMNSPTIARDISSEAATIKRADDSGYADTSTSASTEGGYFSKALVKLNEELMSKMAYLQSQLDSIRINMFSNNENITTKKDAAAHQPALDGGENQLIWKQNIDTNDNSSSNDEGIKLQTPKTSNDSPIDLSKRTSIKSSTSSSPERNKDLQRANIRWRNGETNISCENTCRKENEACDANCTFFQNKDVEKDVNSKRESRRSDADYRYQIPGPIPVSSPAKLSSLPAKAKSEELTNSDIEFFQKNMKKYKDYIKVQKLKLQKLEDLDDAAAQNADQKPILSTESKRHSADIKSVDGTKDSPIKERKSSIPKSVPVQNFPAGSKTTETEAAKNVQGRESRFMTTAQTTSLSARYTKQQSINLERKDLNGKVKENLKVNDPSAGQTSRIDETLSTNLPNAEANAVTQTTEDAQTGVNVKKMDDQISENVQRLPATGLNCDCNKGNARTAPGKCSCVKGYSSLIPQNTNAGRRLSLNTSRVNPKNITTEKKFSMDSQGKNFEEKVSLDSQGRNTDNKLSLGSPSNAQYNTTEKRISFNSNASQKNSTERSNVAVQGENNPVSKEKANSDTDDVCVQTTSMEKILRLDKQEPINVLSGRRFSDAATQNPSIKKVNADKAEQGNSADETNKSIDVTKEISERPSCSKWQAIPDGLNTSRSSPEDTYCISSPPPITSSPYQAQSTKDQQTQLATDVNDAENQLDGTQAIEQKDRALSDGAPKRDSVDSIAKTYSVPCSPRAVQCSRAASPENTDQEISSLTDLPSERSDRETSTPSRCKQCTPLSPGEADCKRRADRCLSPGEDKATTTSTESRAAPLESMSEGEVPQSLPFRRASGNQEHFNIPEAKRPSMRESTSAAKVEQALQAIGLELARCRQLLLQTRSVESPSPSPPPKIADPLPEPVKIDRSLSSPNPPKVEDPSPDPLKNEKPSPSLVEDTGGGSQQVLELSQNRSSISLRKAEARPRIGDAYTPSIIFTLHIGTIVLSDEAVIHSRELSLVLTWQFYEQNVSMCRLRPGRVVAFNFSTEYDVKLTEQFLDYLKSEELTIKICEESKPDVPFASCSLPLREALLHTNRRADLSLALVAGPRMPRTGDSLDGRDELGVLDVWCMLRADPRLLPDINKAIAHTRLSDQVSSSASPLTKRASVTQAAAIMSQINEDDQEELRISADLEPLHIDRLPVRNSDNIMDRGVPQLPSNQARQERVRHNNYGYRNSDSTTFPVYHPPPHQESITSKRSSGSDVTSADIKHPPSSMLELKSQVSFDNKWAAMESGRQSSGIIVNEVPANIKNTMELKKALEFQKSYKVDSLRPPVPIKEEPTSDRLSLSQSQGQGSVLADALERRQKSIQKIASDRNNLMGMAAQPSVDNYLNNSHYADLSGMIKKSDMDSSNNQANDDSGEVDSKKYDYVSRMVGARKAAEAFKRVTIKREDSASLATSQLEGEYKPTMYLRRIRSHSIDITVLWLALNEECSAMGDPNVQRLYVAYTFLGRGGAELETPISLPKPKQYQDKCHYNFKKSFQLTDSDLPILGRMAKCRSPNKGAHNLRESVVFTVVSEPVEDPLGLNNCEDIGNAHLYLGDLLAYSAGSDTYTEVIPVRATVADDIIGVLAVRVDGLDVVRKCLMISTTDENNSPSRSF